MLLNGVVLSIFNLFNQATFDKVKPVLDMQGENVFYLGALGAGLGNGNVPEIMDYFLKLEK